MAPSLDTNLLLRLVLKDIREQYDTVNALVTKPGARYRVSDMAVAEIVHALAHHYEFSREQIGEIIRAILTSPSLETNTALLDSVVSRFIENHGLSFVDCYLAEDASASGCIPLLTFDADLIRHHPAAIDASQWKEEHINKAL